MTSVWPALWPPWKRTTMSACSDNQSTILPFPSSPHWAPTTPTFPISQLFPLQLPSSRHDRFENHPALALTDRDSERHSRGWSQASAHFPRSVLQPVVQELQMGGTSHTPDKGCRQSRQARRRPEASRGHNQPIDIPQKYAPPGAETRSFVALLRSMAEAGLNPSIAAWFDRMVAMRTAPLMTYQNPCLWSCR